MPADALTPDMPAPLSPPTTHAAGLTEGALSALPLPPVRLGESPLWHPLEQCLYWLDIPGRQLHRWQPAAQHHAHWPLPSETGCCAAVLGGGLLLAARDGLFSFDPRSGARQRLAAPPYDPAAQRFNDGKPDAQGRFWVGTLDDARQPAAALYRWQRGPSAGQPPLQRLAEGITNSNGLAFSPDGRTLYWADTSAHAITAFDLAPGDGSLSRRRLFHQFAPRQPGADLAAYGGRPDGAAVDAEGRYWVALFEGQRLACLSPEGVLLAELPLPVRCPTMPCFGGPDLRTLYITTARENRPADELAAQPLAGAVLQVRVAVPGLPAHLVQL